MTKEDLRRLFEEGLADIFTKTMPAGAAKRHRLMHTSGTTGLPLPVLYTARPDWNPKYLGTGPRVLMISGSKALRLDFARSYADPDTPPSDIICLSTKSRTDEIERVRTDFQPTSLVGSPSTLLRATQKWPPDSCDLIISITLTGELATKEMTAALKTRFPKAVIRNYYPSIEAGLMGEQCDECEWNEFHPITGVSFEISEPDENGVGNLLISKENDGGLSLKSYRTGDLAEADQHSDGRKTFRLHGRQGFDYIKLADVLLIREEFDRVARDLERHIGDYKAEVRTAIHNGVPKHHLTIYVRLSDSADQSLDASGFLSEEFARRLFVTPNSTLKDAINDGIFKPLEVHIVSEVIHTGTKPQRLRLIDTP